MQVLVRDNDEQALPNLKRRTLREGVFREMKARSFYEKPSEKGVREKAEAIRRHRKMLRKKLQRENPAPGAKAKPRGRPPASGAVRSM